ncbi:MAG TPA: hypothetical protein VF477_21705 [Mycobacterium sp.]
METVSRRLLSAPVRLILLLALCASVVAGCTTPPGGTPGGTTPPGLPTFPTAPTTTTPALPKGALTAYRSSTELGLVDGTKVVATAAGTFTPSSEPFVTEDGRFLFARSTDGKLVTLDARTGKSQDIPLPKASRLGTAGASTIVWWEQPNRLMQLDLAAEAVAPVLRQNVNLPQVANASDPMLLTARSGTAVISRVESTPSPSGGPDTLYAVRGAGAPTSLGQADANTPVAVAELSPDGRTLAYALYRRSSNSCGTAAVVVSSADGSQQTYDVAAPGPTASSEVLHMWWQASHGMALSLGTWQCDPASAYSPRVWELGPDKLVQMTPPTVALQAVEVVPGQRALIIPQGGPTPEQSGTLVVEDSGRRFPVKPDVNALDVIPAQAPE